MRRVRAYSRDERKRLIIHVLAEAIRTGEPAKITCAAIAQKMDIVASTKLREILTEMVRDELLLVEKEQDAGIAGFRFLYQLNYDRPAFNEPHQNRKSAKITRSMRLNTARGTEIIIFS